MENMVWHFNIEKPPHLGDRYPICPTWSDFQNRGGDGAGTSRAHDEVDDD